MATSLLNTCLFFCPPGPCSLCLRFVIVPASIVHHTFYRHRAKVNAQYTQVGSPYDCAFFLSLSLSPCHSRIISSFSTLPSLKSDSTAAHEVCSAFDRVCNVCLYDGRNGGMIGMRLCQLKRNNTKGEKTQSVSIMKGEKK